MATSLHTRSAARYGLVNAGHHFLFEVLPFRRPESHYALESFVAAAQRITLPTGDYDAVLLRCLTVLDSRATACIPRLVDRYLSDAFTPMDCLTRFAQCVEDFLHFQCISDGSVQEAIRFVNDRYAESTCTPDSVAVGLRLRLPTLDVLFKRQTGGTLTEHIRNVRLDRAAILLATTNMSVKEVWTGVGYNFHSNFDKDFKRRFHVTPRGYRTRALRPVAQDFVNGNNNGNGNGNGKATIVAESHGDARGKTSVLIVDDDDVTRTMAASFLRLEGYAVSVAANGPEGLRAAERISPDVMLIDYRLPADGMDGLELLRTIRQRFNGDAPNIAIFTADWDLLDRSGEVYALGAIIVSKLCDLEQVKDLVLYLSTGQDGPLRLTSVPWWRRWIE